MVARVAGVCFGLIMIMGVWLAGRGIAPAGAFNRSVYLPFVPASLTQFFDDFSNPNSGWPTYSDANVQFGYLSGGYQILVHTSGFGETVWPGVSATAFSEQVDAHYATANTGAYGLAFDISGVTNSYSYYIFIVAPSYQQFGIFEKLNGSWTSSPPLTWTSSSAILSGQATNHLAVVRSGSSIQAWINGVLVASITNSDVPTGDVGLFGETFSTTTEADARFDNFSVGGTSQVSSQAIPGSAQPSTSPLGRSGAGALAGAAIDLPASAGGRP